MATEEQTDRRITRLEDNFILLNHEMGQILGQLVWIKLIMGSTLVVAIGQVVITALK